MAALVGALYLQATGFDFVVLDDDRYVTQNPHVLAGLGWAGVRWAFTTFEAANWHPLTWLSHMADVSLFGPGPSGPHGVNVVLHAVNTLLVFLVLRAATGASWRSAFVAAAFGVHPLHVESVAWVSERKDLLSAMFGLLALGAYVRYARRPSVPRYIAVACAMALGLLCKPMLVTLPFVLVLMDVWPLQRFPASWRGSSRSILEKLPLVALAAGAAIMTVLAQSKGGAIDAIGPVSPGLRLANAAVATAMYLANTVWPASLAVFYPHPASLHAGVGAASLALSIVVLLAISVLVVRFGRRHAFLPVGWAWFLGMLVPVLGLVQVGAQSRADRYTYLPLIGVFVMVAWGVQALLSRTRSRTTIAAMAAGVALVALSIVGSRQIGYWRDDFTLFGRALQVTRDNWLAWNNLGVAYLRLGQLDRAETNFVEAVRIRPEYATAWYNLGAIQSNDGRNEAAIASFNRAIAEDPAYFKAWNNLGTVYGSLGNYDEAVRCFRSALSLRPDHANAWYNLGLVRLKQDDRPAVLDVVRHLSSLDRSQAEALLAAADAMHGDTLNPASAADSGPAVESGAAHR